MSGFHPSFRTLLAGCIVIILAASSASAFDSTQEALAFVWSDGSGNCSQVDMELTADNVWSCPVIIPEAGMHWFQFWVGGPNDPKYGADPDDPAAVVLAADPPLIPVDVATPGVFTVQLDEIGSTYTWTGAPGSMIATIELRDDPAVPPADLRAVVVDNLSGELIGTYTPAPGSFELTIGHLEPGRTYDLEFVAEGYQQVSRTETVTDVTPLAFTVIMEVLVPNADLSWGTVKELFR